MTMSIRIIVILTIFIASVQPVFAAKKVKTDHPLLNPYSGSTIYKKDIKQFDEYRVFASHDIFCCGPIPMLKVLQEELKKENIDATVFLEEKMACGIGACNGCVVKIKKSSDDFDYKRVCREGPAFSLSEVVFDE